MPLRATRACVRRQCKHSHRNMQRKAKNLEFANISATFFNLNKNEQMCAQTVGDKGAKSPISVIFLSFTYPPIHSDLDPLPTPVNHGSCYSLYCSVGCHINETGDFNAQ